MLLRIDPQNQTEVIWLQRALTRLLRHPYPMIIGEVNHPLTIKALRIYQAQNDLPMTTAVDEPTLQHIHQQLAKRGLTIS